MSRSYRKPVAKETNKKFFKRVANKKVRRSKIISNNKWYKKLYCSWNISDYRFYNEKPIHDIYIDDEILETVSEQLKSYNKLCRK